MELVSIAAPLVAGVGATILGYEYKKYRKDGIQEENRRLNWLNETLDVIGRGGYRIDRTHLRSDPDYDKILDDLDRFSQRLSVKVNNPAGGISPSAIKQIKSVQQVYAKASAVAGVKNQKEGMELLLELFEMAQRENTDEIDMDDALDNATTLSPVFSQLMNSVNKAGVNQSELAETTQEVIRDWEPEDFAQFIKGTSEGSENIEEVVEYSMNIFFELAYDVSNSVYDELQLEKENLRG